jgi:hypothetical protein
MPTTIGRRVPPQRLVTLVNPLVRAVARSPLHGLVDDAVLVLHVVGRRTGRRYDIPVGFLPLGGDLVVVTQHAWRANLRGVAELEVTHRGRRGSRQVHLDEDPSTVAATLHGIVLRHGPVMAQRRLGLVFPGGHEPTTAELVAPVRAFGLAALHVSDPP